ncbi:MAG: bifunctional phosphoribosylaminoimidazolecarboxamide formyltransferase/IMP cyclohydrolase [Clostridia bacterium]
MRALISVSDKEGIVDLASRLEKLGVEIISTGGSAKRLKDSGINVIEISEVTKFPECLDGRVKTLHPNIFAGILAMRDNKEHMETIENFDISTVDIVVVNLYPFKETVSKPNVNMEDAIENIDIGGPSMLRAAAKNFRDVVVMTDPKDYDAVLTELENNKAVSLDTKYKLALKVFSETASYDALISKYLRERINEKFTDKLTLTFEKQQDMRYGENPHQEACFYKETLGYAHGITAGEQLHGKELSYNNINDANGAINLVKEFADKPCVVAVKHSSPCGVGVDIDLYGAYKKAYSCDPVSIFGGIVATNQVVDEKTARKMNEIFLEVIIAKDFTETALSVLKSKKNLRLIKLETIDTPIKAEINIRKVSGGLLVQDLDVLEITDKFEVVTERIPTKHEIEDMLFAMKVCKHTNSNGIVLAREGGTLSIGGGQVSRVWSVENCVNHANESILGSTLASDAFFPFRDGVDLAGNHGIKAIIQPGGSVRDEDIIKACNEHGIAMVFTNQRHFKH